MSLAFRSYACGSGENWETICVDLATCGTSLNEVKASLATCIEIYLEGLAESSPAEQQRFATRRAPWHVRAKLAAMTWLFGLRGHARRPMQFTFQSHVPAIS